MVSTAAFHARIRGSIPGFGGLKETKMFLPHPRVKVSIVGSLRDREVACSASDRQGSNFETCVWRTVSSHSSHHPQEVLLAQFNIYVHKGGLKSDSFHFCTWTAVTSALAKPTVGGVCHGLATIQIQKANVTLYLIRNRQFNLQGEGRRSFYLGKNIYFHPASRSAEKTVVEKNYLFHTESAPNFFFLNTPALTMDIEW